VLEPAGSPQGRGGLRLGAVCLLVAMGLLTPAAARAATKPPVALLLPPGAFVFQAAPMFDAREAALRAGFEPMQLDYPLGPPKRAWRFVRSRTKRLMRRGRVVVAYGESAGGTLAADLAVHGLSRFTVANSAIPNLLRWEPNRGDWRLLATTRAHRRFLSPALHRARTPILAMASPEDTTVPYAMARRWARADPRVHLLSFSGGHTAPAGEAAAYTLELAGAFGWLSSRVNRARLAQGKPPLEGRPWVWLLTQIELLVDRLATLTP
jgi:acetyl esterase/lipase